ncbi:hypothetical protein [Kitasatospora sp. HPMI-4]|uniref:hypothetical protein n=1 Tax=Kitasatospora sp. HPMI-4 TaxID=3448443 RepID=UPI003F1D2FDC
MALRRVLAAAAVTALAMVGPLAVGPAAQAADAGPATPHLAPSTAGATRVTFTVPAGVTTISMAAGSAHASVTRSPKVSSLTAINCTLTVDTPIHELGIVHGNAALQCSAPMQNVVINIGLYSNGSLVASSGAVQCACAGINSADAYVPYTPGVYQTGAVGNLFYPAGYSPATGTIGENYSPAVSL